MAVETSADTDSVPTKEKPAEFTTAEMKESFNDGAEDATEATEQEARQVSEGAKKQINEIAPTNAGTDALMKKLFTESSFKEKILPLLGVPDADSADFSRFKKALEKDKAGEAIQKSISGLSDEARKGLAEKGDKYQLTEEDKNVIGGAFKEAYGLTNIEKANPEEIKLISGLTREIGGKEMTFEQVFGKDVAVLLSMKCKIVKETEGKNKGKITINGKEEATFGGIIKFLPPEAKAQYDTLKKTDATEEERAKAMKELAKLVTAEKLTTEKMSQITDILKDSGRNESLKNMGPLELITTLMQLWAMVKEAFNSEPKDFATLGDALKDLQAGKNPMESMRNAENTYKQKTEGINDPNELLAIYLNPDGAEAKYKLGEKIPYRITLKKVIKDKLETDIGVKIDKIESETGSAAKIFANKDGRKFEISVDKAAKKMTVAEIKTANNTEQISALQTQLSPLKSDDPKSPELQRQIAKLTAENGKGTRYKIPGEFAYETIAGDTDSLASGFKNAFEGGIATPSATSAAETQSVNTPAEKTTATTGEAVAIN
jgi:hypothetical protein